MIDNEIKIREIDYNTDPELKVLRSISRIDLMNIKDLLKNKLNKLDKFNLTPNLLLEGIFYPIKALVQNDKI